uniref:Aromatic-L-amino-acid decarboxylase n=1 Tax=Megaselia scalaris TaxID=36166 RepID=T1GEZ3_MEGSC
MRRLPIILLFPPPWKVICCHIGRNANSRLSTVVSTWNSNPAGTELETVVLDWFGRAMEIPKGFLKLHPGSAGGSVVLSSGSESILISMIAARSRAIQNLKGSSNLHESFFLPQLVAYCSKDANSSVEKAAKISLVQIRIIDVDKFGRFRTDLLKKAIEEDLETGLVPFYVLATVGTTICCAFDDIYSIGEICQRNNVWFHVDGSYGGNSFILPEMRKYSKGLQYADSFNVNSSKALLVTIEFAALYVRDMKFLEEALSVNRVYFPREHEETTDFRHYGISLSRRMRGLKFWFVMRLYGIEGLQKHLRNLMSLAQKLEELVKEDDRFTVCNDVSFTTICFRLKAPNDVNKD